MFRYDCGLMLHSCANALLERMYRRDCGRCPLSDLAGFELF